MPPLRFGAFWAHLIHTAHFGARFCGLGGSDNGTNTGSDESGEGGGGGSDGRGGRRRWLEVGPFFLSDDVGDF